MRPSIPCGWRARRPPSYDIARAVDADLIHTNMEVLLEGALAAALLRKPHVLHYRGNTLDRPKLVFDALVAAWTRGADTVYCISGATAELFRRRGHGDKVEVLYNPVDLAAFGARDPLGRCPRAHWAGALANRSSVPSGESILERIWRPSSALPRIVAREVPGGPLRGGRRRRGGGRKELPGTTRAPCARSWASTAV